MREDYVNGKDDKYLFWDKVLEGVDFKLDLSKN
jgi:hypothetical protein